MDPASVVKRPGLLVIAAIVVCLVVAVFAACWASSRQHDERIEATQGLALKLAAGDTNAIGALKVLGVGAVPELLGLVEYRDPFWRRKAWEILPKLPVKVSRPLLFKVGPVKAGQIRVAGCKALGSMGSLADAAVPTLLGTLQDSESYIANEAAAALGKIGPPSIAGLIAALNSKNPGARHAAAYGLGEMGSKAEPAIPALITKLDDTDPEVRTSSASSLTSIGFPMVAAVNNVLDHGDTNARQMALRELFAFDGSLRGLIAPLSRLARAEQPEQRRQAIQALIALRLTDDTTLGLFRETLRDPIPEVRLAALSALNLIAWRAATVVPDAIDCLKDSSAEVRKSAARLLGALGPAARDALPDLKRRSEDDDAAVRLVVQDAMAKIAPEKTSPAPATNRWHKQGSPTSKIRL
jgi:HEAT repeat protein